MDDIEAELKVIEEKARLREYDLALQLCNAILDRHPHAYRALAKRSFIHELMRNHDQAIADMTSVIAMKPREPCFLFDRAVLLTERRDYGGAMADLESVIKLCDEWRDDYYREAAHFFRAYAALKLERPRDALVECHEVRPDFRWWIEGALRTCSEVVAEANAKLGNQSSRGGNERREN